MAPARIRILGGSLDEEKLRLTIHAESVVGQPKVGEAVYPPPDVMTATYHEIIAIRDYENSNRFDLMLNFSGPEFEGDWQKDWMPKLAEGRDTAVCWLTRESFARLPIDQKYQSFTQFAEMNNVGNVSDFVKHNLTRFIKIVIGAGRPSSLSKFGGLPLAPAGFQFPKDRNGQSALFICQLHLSAVKHFPTAKEIHGNGILYFFGTINENGQDKFDSMLVTYCDKIDDLHLVNLPGDLADYGVYPERELLFDEQIGLPMNDNYDWVNPYWDENEQEVYSLLTNVLWEFNREQIFTFMRPSVQIPPSYFFSAYLRHANLDYHAWCNADGTIIPGRFEQLNEEGLMVAKSMQWRHLFDFESYLRDVFQLSNFKGEFDRYCEGYTVMISEKDLHNFDFSKVITISNRIQVD